MFYLTPNIFFFCIFFKVREFDGIIYDKKDIEMSLNLIKKYHRRQVSFYTIFLESVQSILEKREEYESHYWTIDSDYLSI